MKNLVIVESPTKARTLTQFLGKDYIITASMGHMRDLPRGEFGVDVEHEFEPKYVIPREKIKAVNVLVKSTEDVEKIYLATDPDREGEAIAWNLLEIIKTKRKSKKRFDYERVVFHEITKDAVLEAFEHPRKIFDDLVSAQVARRVLDRLVGYKLSPLLWKKVKSKLSAGRVQSVALRLIVDREREIEAFKSDEYWVVEVEVSKVSKVSDKVSNVQESDNFIATVQKVGQKKLEVKNKEQADKVVADLETAKYKVIDVTTRDAKKYPNPPFTTSTLQQTAANRLGFVPKRSMRAAQNLYEQGLITYMRTDSVNLSAPAVEQTRKYIVDEFGKDYVPAAARKYKAQSKLVQEAHEAIRPTNINVKSVAGKVGSDEERLYDLIWKRMVVCQMAEAIVAETAIDIEAKTEPGSDPVEGRTLYTLRANGQQVKFDGWYKVYEKLPIKEQLMPVLAKDEELTKQKINPQQKFTEPPPRYSEATLIRDLEKNEIGRPSTYAPTISTLYDRLYIEKMEGKKIAPTPVGCTTVDFLVKYFPNIVDLKFTAKMENDLDEVAAGREDWRDVMKVFWEPFEKQVLKVGEEAEKMKVEVEETDEVCEKCGKPMVVRYGKFGKFLACSGYPDCKNTKPLIEQTGLVCPNDGGNVVVKRTKRGKSFWGCANYPKCTFASWTKPDLPKAETEEVSGVSKVTKVSNFQEGKDGQDYQDGGEGKEGKAEAQSDKLSV